MTSPWQPYREPLRTTLVRTFAIAVVVGAVLARFWGGLARWPLTTLLVLWPSFGGHWVELWFLSWLRPRLAVARAVQVGARIGVWFIGGTVLALGMALTAMALAGYRPAQWPRWWLGGSASSAWSWRRIWRSSCAGGPASTTGAGSSRPNGDCRRPLGPAMRRVAPDRRVRTGQAPRRQGTRLVATVRLSMNID